MYEQDREANLELSKSIKTKTEALNGQDLGYGLVLEHGVLTSRFSGASSTQQPAQTIQEMSLFHYRNLSNPSCYMNTNYHALMHFGTIESAYARAFAHRNIQLFGDNFTEDKLGTDAFKLSTTFMHHMDYNFGAESFMPVRPVIRNPFYMPDIGQTQYLQNRAVLYACGLFTEKEVDEYLFTADGYVVDDIDQRVMARLKERGYDSIAYINNIEDPGSLSFIILDTEQVRFGTSGQPRYKGFRYLYMDGDNEKILEQNAAGDIKTIKCDVRG